MNLRNITIATAFIFFIQIALTMNTSATTDKIVTGPVYLSKADPIYIEIKKRVFADWKECVRRAKSGTEENQQKKKEVATWPKAKQEKFEALGIKTLEDYNTQTYFDINSFFLFFGEAETLNESKFMSETDFRVRSAGADKYVAEFWEDLLVANSEANAIAWAKELAESPRAKMHPEEDLGNVEEIKKTYAAARKAIESGKQKRYNKLMAFLYARNADKSISFKDPFQPMYDFK